MTEQHRGQRKGEPNTGARLESEDLGCSWQPTCLGCPLPKCREDMGYTEFRKWAGIIRRANGER